VTHLEILAGKVDRLAQDADELAKHYVECGDAPLTCYYVGKSSGLHTAADLLRWEALDREGIDKEVSK